MYFKTLLFFECHRKLKRPNISQNVKVQAKSLKRQPKTSKRKPKLQSATQNVKVRAKMSSASQNVKARAKTSKLKLKHQSASQIIKA